MAMINDKVKKKMSDDQLWYDRMFTVTFLFQRLRVWSRLGIVMYLIMLHQVVMWVIGLPDLTTSQAVIVSVISSLATPIFGFYIKSGSSFYEYYGSLKYSNKISKYLDRLGFILDKLRIVPLMMLIYYCFLLYFIVNWGMLLGVDLTAQQAAFISTFASSATLVFGFFVTTGEVNMSLEEVFVKRNSIQTDNMTDVTVNDDGDIQIKTTIENKKE